MTEFSALSNDLVWKLDGDQFLFEEYGLDVMSDTEVNCEEYTCFEEELYHECDGMEHIVSETLKQTKVEDSPGRLLRCQAAEGHDFLAAK